MAELSREEQLLQERLELRENELALLEVTDFQALMERPEFHRFLWRLFESTHLWETTFTNSGWSAFNEGMRSVGLKHWSLVQGHCPDKFYDMTRTVNNLLEKFDE